LALQCLLTAAGEQSTVYVGVTKTAGKFSAHAWVEHEQRVLLNSDRSTHYIRLAELNSSKVTGHSGGIAFPRQFTAPKPATSGSRIPHQWS